MNSVRSLKISISGVRGIVGETLSPFLLNRFAQAFGTYLNSGTVLVGRDTRTSGEMIQHAVISGLLSAGCNVIDGGILPVPTVGLAVPCLGADGAVAITASHNPVEWNALKFLRADGIYLNEYQGEALLDIYHGGEFKRVSHLHAGKVRYQENIFQWHKSAIFKSIDVETIKKRRFKAALDCCNGAGSLVTPYFLQSLGCEVFPVHCEPNGIFPHHPEPVPENIENLCQAVRKNGADIGFAQDPDADRLALVTEQGTALSEQLTLALVVDFVLSRAKTEGQKVVVNLSTTKTIDDLCKKYRATLIRTPIGEVHVAEKMKKEGALIGGEGGGGVIYPVVRYGRDSYSAIALLLEMLAKRNIIASEAVACMPKYEMIKEGIQCSMDNMRVVLHRLEQVYEGEVIDTRDGIKIIRENVWAHVRPSNTEPVLRVIAEGKDRRVAEGLLQEIHRHIDVP